MATSTFLADLSNDLSERGNVVLRTNNGEILVELFWDSAPKTCRNFFELSRSQYYDNVKFHRISRGFVIQGGDPTGTGLGGESIYGKFFADEIDPRLSHDAMGVVSMANIGKPDTNGSQFFITLGPTPSLDGKSTIFGCVAKGMDVVKRIGSLETNRAEVPLKDVVIYKALVDLDYSTS